MYQLAWRKHKKFRGRILVLFIVPLACFLGTFMYLNQRVGVSVFAYEGVTSNEIQEIVDNSLSKSMNQSQVKEWLQKNHVRFEEQGHTIKCSVFADSELLSMQRRERTIGASVRKLVEKMDLSMRVTKMPVIRVWAPTFILQFNFDKTTGKYSGLCIQKPIGYLKYSSC